MGYLAMARQVGRGGDGPGAGARPGPILGHASNEPVPPTPGRVLRLARSSRRDTQAIAVAVNDQFVANGRLLHLADALPSTRHPDERNEFNEKRSSKERPNRGRAPHFAG